MQLFRILLEKVRHNSELTDKRLKCSICLDKMVASELRLVLISGKNAVRHFDLIVDGIGESA